MKKVIKNLANVAFLALAVTSMVFGLGNLQPPQFRGWHDVVVQPGQSLWTICVANCPNADTRDVITAVCQRDHISGNKCIQPGQTLLVPTQAS